MEGLVYEAWVGYHNMLGVREVFQPGTVSLIFTAGGKHLLGVGALDEAGFNQRIPCFTGDALDLLLSE